MWWTCLSNLLHGSFSGNEWEEVSPNMLIEPQSLASQPRRSEEILEDEGNALKMDHSAMKMTLEEVIQHKEQRVTQKRGNITICYKK